MATAKLTTAQICANLVEPAAKQMGLDLWDVRFEKEGSCWYLRFFIDKEGGINIDDCEIFSKTIDKIIDDADPISQSYFMEVSSPGIERDLIKLEHFLRYIGKKINIKLIREKDGIKHIHGVLSAYQDDTITVNDGDKIYQVAKTQTAYVRLHDDFDFGGNND